MCRLVPLVRVLAVALWLTIDTAIAVGLYAYDATHPIDPTPTLGATPGNGGTTLDSTAARIRFASRAPQRAE